MPMKRGRPSVDGGSLTKNCESISLERCISTCLKTKTYCLNDGQSDYLHTMGEQWKRFVNRAKIK